MTLRWTALAAITASALAVGCSDGGGGGAVVSGGGSGSGGGGGSSGPTYTPGVFAASSVFADRCENPRTGVDITGAPFPDRAGSILEENFFLRSWTEETYLWNDEVTDQNPGNFNSPTAYFEELRTFALTPSGKEKDDFHFFEPTADVTARINSAPSSGYGFSLVVFSTFPPRDYRIAYTEPGSPAAQEVGGTANFIRGTRILEIDGVDLVNGGTNQQEIDILNAGLFPATTGETHEFVVEDPGGSPRTISVTSANVVESPVLETEIISTPTGDVGYILFNTFGVNASEEAIADAISTLDAAGVTDLVLDLRYNGGGFLAIAAQLGYMIAGPGPTSGETFEALRFNTGTGGVNPVIGGPNNPVPFYSTGLGFTVPNGAALDSLDLDRVFILTTGGTCSASEAVINGLRGVDIEVILIGDTTCGKPFGFYPRDNCGTTYYTIQFQGVNAKGFGDFADGFIPGNSSAAFGVRAPGCVVDDDFDNQLGSTSEALLAAALQFRQDGSCPALPTSSSIIAEGSTSIATGGLATLRPEDVYVMRNNRDMRTPY
ncbi:MAG: S41 family peptidase [Pseudomonadota bacterium]